ncbi:undecaprenyldiphospho-muramoylpentapeptide beta-N-acetylglucosaminyltransferase [Robiginitalea marina]|uniref:UDP-N-acetylglucosamine--N-acetylmuramyl-(pentapeptide) pyrophosphoryl-undecaprenol N-acetylglucosamine transferase n=1 Tax=Robiginitalea marina TaxID=2954105 RepID=A0ABT1AYT3_9FLAO|nr:undecaprenyldiphospho-muramoylpentapeptide beta-N-acetylglucosaminyltransferase [Robiginitalea marina]
MGNYRFLLSGGGTGGHIYPAVAIADELKRRFPEAAFLFVGARDRMEMEKVPQAGYPIKGLWISGLERKLSFKNLLFPIKLLSSLLKANTIIGKFRPHLVIGTGGFASGPTLRAAAARGIPCVLQEQNSFAGKTNKWLARYARRIFVAYDGMEQFFPEKSLRLTGNPVRSTLMEGTAEPGRAREAFGLEPGRQTLLVLGGSQGARRINQLVAKELDFFREMGFQVLWQCGRGYFEQYRGQASDGVEIRPFISDMGAAYCAADLILSRAGAGSVSELCLVGKPVLFIPSPNVAEDHQRKNAEAIARQGAAVMLTEDELEGAFEATFSELVCDPGRMQRLGTNMKALARPDATRQIVDELEQVLKETYGS